MVFIKNLREQVHAHKSNLGAAKYPELIAIAGIVVDGL